MEYLSGYIRTIITVSFFYAIISMLLPDGDMKKYCRFAAGIVITACLITPLADFKNISLDDIGYTDVPYSETDFNTQIAVVFQNRLEEEIKREFNVEATIEIDENFNIIEVHADSPKKEEIEKYLGLS